MGSEEDYARVRQLRVQGNVDATNVAFQDLAQRYFGKTDPKTAEYRQQLRDLGFRIMFDLTRAERLALLRHPATQRALASCS